MSDAAEDSLFLGSIEVSVKLNQCSKDETSNNVPDVGLLKQANHRIPRKV